jgi:excisionase family DNA binding protein
MSIRPEEECAFRGAVCIVACPPGDGVAKGISMAAVQALPIQPIAVTIEQAAKLIGTNDKQIRRAIYARELPAVRLGKSYSIAIADLTKWFEHKKKFA